MEADLVAMYEEKVLKLEESRLALRKAVKIQDRVIKGLQKENLRLTADEERRGQADIEGQQNAKQSTMRISLENEVRALKSEILSSQHLDGEVMLSAGDTEVMPLKERIPAESECKKAEAEKKEAAKAWKIVEAEKSRANEERRSAGIEPKKSEEIGVQLENVFVQIQRNCIGADSEMRESEEQRVIAEANTKKAMEGKRHDDQLEDIWRKIEGLQNEILEFTSSRKLVEAPVDTPDIRSNSETAKMKLLEEQLKSKKKQLKHAKKVAKLEIDRNKILQLELLLLKKECVQFSCLVNTCFPYCSEGRDDHAKSGNIFNSPIFNLKKKFFVKESLQVHLHCNKDLDASDFLKQTIDSNAPLLPCSVGNCAQCTSVIDSKMESRRRGSNREMLSSALNSSTSLFSDGPLTGSQERGAFSDTVPAIAAVEKSNTSKRCIDAVGRKAGHSKKRKRVKSIDHLYSEFKNWQLGIDEMLDGMLNGQTGKSLEKNACMMSNLECKPIALLDKAHKKGKESCGEVPLKHLCDLNGLHKDIRREVQAFDAVMGDSGRANLGSHKEMEGNYMKPLDLHNAIDEDRYRKPIQVPLSPTLPVIEVHNTRGLVDENSFKASFSKQANQGPTCKIDDLNMDTESDRWKFGTYKTSHVPALNKNGGIANPFENVTNNGSN